MKNHFYAFAVICLMVFASSCTEDPITLQLDIPETPICLDANPNWGPEQYYIITITKADIEAALSAAGASLDDAKLESAKLGNAELEMETSSLSFDEMANTAIFIRDVVTGPVTAANKGTQVAYTEAIAAGSTHIAMKLNGPELRDYMFKDEFQLVVEVLNAEKVGGTPAFCFKLTKGSITISVKQ